MKHIIPGQTIPGGKVARIRQWNKHKPLPGECTICHRIEKLETHRILPGSKYTKKGTRVVCKKCHEWIHAMLRMKNAKTFEECYAVYQYVKRIHRRSPT